MNFILHIAGAYTLPEWRALLNYNFRTRKILLDWNNSSSNRARMDAGDIMRENGITW